MKITLRGCNGKKREIPLEELIEKFWDDKQSKPTCVEMSTSTCDEEITQKPKLKNGLFVLLMVFVVQTIFSRELFMLTILK